MDFKNLHEQKTPILICNVWDVASAKTAEKLNFQAIGTSSAAIAAMLGYNDGEEMSFSELEYIIKRIKTCTKLPLSVDLESGYSTDPIQIVEHIKKLVDLGVVGINIEDSIVGEKRILLETEHFAKTLYSIKNQLEKDNVTVFINARTDAFLLGVSNAISETESRIRHYENAGADGIFVPCIEQESDIKAVIKMSDLPINVMCMPNLPDFNTLNELGIKRISMGNFLFNKVYENFEDTLASISAQKSFKPIF